MSFLSKYKTDKTAEIQGTWVEVDAGVEFKIARLNNEKARAERRALEKPYRNFQGGIPDSVSEDILRKVIARTVLLDWRTKQEDGTFKNIIVDDGVDVPYSAENVEKLLKDYPDLLNDVVGLSMARETFQAEATEAVKND
jgi:hypothetical protein